MIDKALYEKLRIASLTGTELTLAGDEAKAVVDALRAAALDTLSGNSILRALSGLTIAVGHIPAPSLVTWPVDVHAELMRTHKIAVEVLAPYRKRGEA